MLVSLIIGLIFYCFASIFLLLTFLGRREIFTLIAKIFSLLGLGVLTILFFQFLTPLFSGNVGLSREIYLFGFAWLFTLALCFLWRKLNNVFLFIGASPLLFLLLHTVMLLQREETSAQVPFEGVLFIAHIAAIFFSLIVLFAAGIAAILFLIQEKSMKKKKRKVGLMKILPSLQVLDEVNYFATILGFPAYTIGIACGFIWAGTAWGANFSGDIKEVTSILAWLCYAFLFHMRIGLSYKGKKPALCLLAVCALSLFSLLIVNIFFETHHQF